MVLLRSIGVVGIITILHTTGGCKSNVYEPLDDPAHERNDAEEAEFKESFRKRDYKSLAMKLKDRLQKVLSPEVRAKYRKLLADTMIVETLEKTRDEAVTDTNAMIKKGLASTPDPTPENIQAAEDGLEEYEKNPNPNAIEIEKMKALHSMGATLRIKKGFTNGTFDREKADREITDADGERVIQNFEKTAALLQGQGKSSQAERYTDAVKEIKASAGDTTAARLIQYLSVNAAKFNVSAP